MLVCAIFLIVVLAQDETAGIEKAILIVTIIYWMLQNAKRVLALIFVALLPLIITVLVIYLIYMVCYAD